MRKVKINFETTIPEKFFIEKAVELLFEKTIDSHRLRLHNPKTILEELIQVIDDLNKNKLKNKEYANTLIFETERLISEENELVFNTINKKFFLKILDRKNSPQSNLTQIQFAANLILQDNKTYIEAVYTHILTVIDTLNQHSNIQVQALEELDRIIGYFFVELQVKGYSKTYLHNFVRSIFSGPNHGDFVKRISIIKSLISRTPESFLVIAGINISEPLKNKIQIISDEFKTIQKKDIVHAINLTNENVKKHFEKNKDWTFLSINITCLDYYSASRIVRNKLLYLFDALHMGHSNTTLFAENSCVVIGMNNPTRANIQSFEYQIDGYYRSDQQLYENFLLKISDLKKKDFSDSTLAKIYAGLRYLRLGSESKELENKLLNYWIGIEYIFSTYEADSYTVGRLREYFITSHATVYFKKLLNDFSQSIVNLDLHGLIPNFNRDLSYLTNTVSYDLIISQLEKFPLIAYRAYVLKSNLSNRKKAKGTIEKHRKNLDWNLNRIYRIRNEIVHNAAIKPNIETIVGHLRYYLVFILNGLIDFFLNVPQDINNDGVLSIDDYFIFQELQLENLMYSDATVTFDNLLKIRNPIEYLT